MSKMKQTASEKAQQALFSFTSVLAGVLTLFGTGPLYTATRGWVYEFAVNHYGYSMADFITLVWGALCAAFIFFGARMGMYAFIGLGIATAIARFAV